MLIKQLREHRVAWLLYFAVVLVLIFIIVHLACGKSPAPPAAGQVPPTPAAPPQPYTMYAIHDGVGSIEGVRDGAISYGEAVLVLCDAANQCTGERDGHKLSISLHDLYQYEPPKGPKYAYGSVTVRGTYQGRDYLRHDEKVEISGFDPSDSTVRIGKDAWVSTAELRDHPETREERKARMELELTLAQGELSARRAYASQLRTHFLDQNMDVEVRVSGSKADRLTLEFVLFNAVWAHNFQKGDLIDEIRGKGFKRVDLTDGYDYHVYWTFKD